MRNKFTITEGEAQRILGLHSSKKQLIIEEVTRNEMPICVRNAGEFTFDEKGGYGYIWVKNAGGKGKDYLWYHNHLMGVLNNAVSSDSLEAAYKYYCKCVEGKCKPKTYPIDAKDIPDECDDKRKCSLQTPGGKVETPRGKVDVNQNNSNKYTFDFDAIMKAINDTGKCAGSWGSSDGTKGTSGTQGTSGTNVIQNPLPINNKISADLYYKIIAN
jgi:hypothetical protein